MLYIKNSNKFNTSCARFVNCIVSCRFFRVESLDTLLEITNLSVVKYKSAPAPIVYYGPN